MIEQAEQIGPPSSEEVDAVIAEFVAMATTARYQGSDERPFWAAIACIKWASGLYRTRNTGCNWLLTGDKNVLESVAAEAAEAADAFVPEQWAQGDLALQDEGMVVASFVHRDFEDDKVRALVDVVNARWPDMGPPLT